MSNIYTCLNKNEFEFDGHILVPYRFEDRLHIKNWRNEQMGILRQNQLLTDVDQTHYYHFHIQPSFKEPQPKIVLFSFLEKAKTHFAIDTLIGYGGLTNVDWTNHKAEVSFLIDTYLTHSKERYESYFTAFLTLIKEVAFSELKLNRIFTETFSFRISHMDILEANGFVEEGTLRENTYQNKKYCDSIIHAFLRRGYV